MKFFNWMILALVLAGGLVAVTAVEAVKELTTEARRHGGEAGAEGEPQIAQISEIKETPANERLRQIAVVLLTPILIALIRKWTPVNRKYLPLLAPVVGEALSLAFANLPLGLGAVAGSAGVGVHQVKRQLQKPVAAMALLGAVLFLGSGCAMTRTAQADSYYDKDGKLNRRETKTLSLSIWDALAKLGGFSATQSDRTQSTKIANASSESTATNLVTISGNAVELGKMFLPK